MSEPEAAGALFTVGLRAGVQPWHNPSMTRDEALAEAGRRQAAHPDAKWLAVKRDGEWVVARIGVAPGGIEPTGTAVPPLPQDAPQSELQRITTQYGIGG
jgi:hypothetical protein